MSSTTGGIHHEALKARVNRLIAGDFHPDDVVKLYAGFRFSAYGLQSFREIGDFAAHPNQRERGPVTQVVRDIITSFKPLFDRYMGKQSPSILDYMDRVEANLRLMTEEQSLRMTGRKLSAAKKALEVPLRKVRKGCYDLITPQEMRLLNSLDALVWNPAFREEQIFHEFQRVLVNNKVLRKSDAKLLEAARSFIVLNAMVTMHGAVYVLDNGMRGELLIGSEKKTGHIEVTAAIFFDGYPKQISMAPCVVWTGMHATDHCEEQLKGISGRWGFPLEVRAGVLQAIGKIPAFADEEVT